MESLVSNPRRCRDCPAMLCKTFLCKTEKLDGWCFRLHKMVDGNDVCHLPREPTKGSTKQLEIEF